MKTLFKILGIIFLIVLIVIASFWYISQKEAKIPISEIGQKLAENMEKTNSGQITTNSEKPNEITKNISQKPLEKQYFQTWPFEVARADMGWLTGHNSYIVFYPKNILSENREFPLLIAVNGTGFPAKKYENVLKHLASWGFVVMGNDDENSWFGASTSESIHYAEYFAKLSKAKEEKWEKVEEKFQVFTKVDFEKIGIFGHSQGGVGVFNALTNFKNSHKIKTAIALSPTQKDLANGLGWDYDESEIKVPMFIIAGTGKVDAEVITPLSALENFYKNIENKELTIIGRFANSDHGDVQPKATAYMVAWFLYFLENDETAKQVFVWENPEITENPNWVDVKIKNF